MRCQFPYKVYIKREFCKPDQVCFLVLLWRSQLFHAQSKVCPPSSPRSLISPLFSPPCLPPPLVSTCSLCQAHHVCLRTLPLRWWASYKRRPHGVATSTHCFLYHLRKQGEQRTMRCHFLNPFVLFYTFFFFCPTGAFLPLSSSSSSSSSIPPYGKPTRFSHKLFLHRHPSFPLSVSFFFVFFSFFCSFSSSLVFSVEQWWRGPWDIHDHPLPSLTVWLALYLPAKWLVLTRTGHQKWIHSSPKPIPRS